MTGLPRVAVISLGGTIASTGGGADKVAPNLSAHDLLAAVPTAGRVADLQATSLRRLPSSDLTLIDAIALAGEVRQQVAGGAQGVVVTQGTDTLEEMAFALDCLLDLGQPVVMTGAMRHPEQAGADGPANLLAAVQAAASDRMRDSGVCVVFNDQIHAARFVRKVHTASPSAFCSPLSGPLGAVVEGHVRRYSAPLGRAPCYRVPGAVRQPRVALLRMALGGNRCLLDALPGLDLDGLVVEGFGAGHVPADAVASLEDLARTVPVVLASRTGNGEVLRATYGFAGSESDLLARGLISAGFLDGAKARILLMLLVASGHGPAAVEAAFADAFTIG